VIEISGAAANSFALPLADLATLPRRAHAELPPLPRPPRWVCAWSGPIGGRRSGRRSVIAIYRPGPCGPSTPWDCPRPRAVRASQHVSAAGHQRL